MRAVVISTNFRNVDNWLPMFERLQALGHDCEAFWLPWLGDASAERIREIQLPVRHHHPIDRLDLEGLTLEDLRQLLDEVVTAEVDTVFLCDVQSYPSSAIYGFLRKRSKAPKVIGLQHGLFQSWWLYNANALADVFLCFGERHVRELLPSLRRRAHAVGLPKLDRLLGRAQSGGGYILYLAQRVPEAEHVVRLLAQLEDATGLPVVVRDHPQYPSLVSSQRTGSAHLPASASIEATDYTQQLACAAWVLTPHSTGGLEALLLSKPVVLLPNHGLTAWAGYPGVATDLSVGAVMAALDRARNCTAEIELFLEDVIGGRRFDSADRAACAVLRTLAEASEEKTIPAAAKGRATPCNKDGEPLAGFESLAWLFQSDNRNRGIIRQNFDEAALLWRTIKETRGAILEIGRRHGGTTVLLLEASFDRRVVSIDLVHALHPAVERHLARVTEEEPGRLHLVVGDSRTPSSSGSSYGLLFIDGDGSYDGVRADVVAHWHALQGCDGSAPVALFHDAEPNSGLAHEGCINHCEGVERLCQELVEAGCAEQIGKAGSSLMLRKLSELPPAMIFEARRNFLHSRDDVITLVRHGGIGIELGVAEGILSERFLRRSVLSHLYSVDMYAGDRGHDVAQYRRALERLAPYRDRNTLVKMRFDEALAMFPDNSFDFIYVDGYAHTGEEGGQTFYDWLPKLKPGGVMAGDDYCAEWPLVVAAVDRFLAEHQMPLFVIDCREDAAYCKYPTWFTRKPD